MSIIMKFGGTSVANSAAINQVADIIKARSRLNPVVVTSALAGITDLLLDLAKAASLRKTQSARNALDMMRKRHLAVVSGFRINIRNRVSREIVSEINELETVLDKIAGLKTVALAERDFVASFGERLASWALFGALVDREMSAVRMDSRELIVSDESFGNAEVQWIQTKRNFQRKVLPLIKKGIVPVITGFIAKSASGETTVLGRGGSDYSAAISALALGAGEIQIWKEVSGFMTADPRIVNEARVIPKLSFTEAAELAYFGAKVLHPKTIQPAVQKNIPVRILNTFCPNGAGTVIFGDPVFLRQWRSHRNSVTAISCKKGIAVLNLCSLQMLGPYGFLAKVFEIFSAHRIPVDVVATSEVNISMTVEDAMLKKELVQDLSAIGAISVWRDQAIVSIVGCGVRQNPTVEEKIFTVLKKANIPTNMISKGASAVNFTFIIKRQRCDKAVRRLHAEFFN